ncbi:MAG: hypothetical protein RR275_03155 [Lachnospiraceae bacterium]
MNENMNKKGIHHLCPRIMDYQTNHISFGGNQAWLSRNTAALAGCGPISAANILVAYADVNPDYANQLGIFFYDDDIISQTDYVMLVNDIYHTLKPHELPILSQIYDFVDRNNKFFLHFTPYINLSMRRYIKGVLRYGLSQNIFLQFRGLSTLFCGYTRGITFIKLALTNGYPVTLLTTFNTHDITVFEHPHLYDGRVTKIKRHFVTITDIRESDTVNDTELIITIDGKTATISYTDLYKSWKSIKSFGSGLVYFIPAKDKRTVKKSIKKIKQLFFKR